MPTTVAGPRVPLADGRRSAPFADRLPTLALLAGFLLLFGPTLATLASSVWLLDEQGHGPIILAVVGWIAWSRRDAFGRLPRTSAWWSGGALFASGLLLYVVGKSQGLETFEVGAALPLLAGTALLTRGRAGLQLMAFPIAFLLFVVPLPASLVQFLTVPLKMAVSAVAELILFWAGYPVARTGTVLMAGPYQLLVADACAGLHSMFTLEALGLLYLHLQGYRSALRRTLLAVLTVPIAFAANVIRVLVLIWVTLQFGDAAGQGFVHDFAGLLLFMVALVLIVGVDFVLGRFIREVPHDGRH